jgi:hypothetical protein
MAMAVNSSDVVWNSVIVLFFFFIIYAGLYGLCLWMEMHIGFVRELDHQQLSHQSRSVPIHNPCRAQKNPSYPFLCLLFLSLSQRDATPDATPRPRRDDKSFPYNSHCANSRHNLKFPNAICNAPP